MPRPSKKLSEKATRLSDEDVGKIIKLVEAHECLWKTTHSWYHNKKAKSQALQRIGAEVGLDESDVKTKLESLRSYYSKELAKERNSKKSAAWRDDVYTSKWVHFEAMEFIREFVIPRNTVPNTIADSQLQMDVRQEFKHVKEETISDDDSDSYDTGDTNQDYDYSDSEEDDDSDTLAEASGSTEPVRKRKASSSLPEKTNKRVQEDELLIAATKALKKFADGEEAKTSKAKVEDPDAVFAKHIVNELKHITDFRTKQRLKKQILDVIFDAQFGLNDGGNGTQLRTTHPTIDHSNVLSYTPAQTYQGGVSALGSTITSEAANSSQTLNPGTSGAPPYAPPLVYLAYQPGVPSFGSVNNAGVPGTSTNSAGEAPPSSTNKRNLSDNGIRPQAASELVVSAVRSVTSDN